VQGLPRPNGTGGKKTGKAARKEKRKQKQKSRGGRR
jgi:signal recognition particle subunit SRP54